MDSCYNKGKRDLSLQIAATFRPAPYSYLPTIQKKDLTIKKDDDIDLSLYKKEYKKPSIQNKNPDSLDILLNKITRSPEKPRNNLTFDILNQKNKEPPPKIRFQRGFGLQFMYENPELVLQSQSMVLSNTKAYDSYNKLKEIMKKQGEIAKKESFFLGEPRYYIKKNELNVDLKDKVKYYNVKALKNLDNVPLP